MRRLDLRLARPADLVVVVFDRHAHRLQQQADLGAQVVELVLGRDGVVAAVQGDVMAVPALCAVPVGLVRIQPVAGVVDAVVEGDLIEDVELELRPPAALVGDAGLLEVLLGPDGDVARVVGEDPACRLPGCCR
jgi:hypothetical protein